MMIKLIANGLFLLALLLGSGESVSAQPAPLSPRNFLPVLKDGSPAAFVRFARPKQTQALAMLNPEGVGYVSDVFQGFEGVLPAPGNPEGSLYFQVAVDELVTATGTFFVTIQYFDQGQGAVELQYHSLTADDTLALRSSHFFLGNSGHWQAHTFNLSGAVFNHSLPGETDFVIRCPGVPLRQVALTRSPLRTEEPQAVGPLFSQPAVSPPAGFFFAVFPDDAAGKGIWADAALLEQKSQLYRSWGMTQVIDTLSAERIGFSNNRWDFSRYRDLAQALAAQNLVWVPRIPVGDFSALPDSLREGLQPAVGLERRASGPMISLWEPRLAAVYADLLTALRASLSASQISCLVLSLPGSWGPLLQPDAGQGGPDLWAGDPLARQSFQTYIQSRFRSLTALNQAWQTNYGSWAQVTPELGERPSALKTAEVYTFYRQAFATVAEAIVQRARATFPSAQLILEIGDNFFYGATDPRAFAGLAAATNCSLVMSVSSALPTQSYMWQMLSWQCRQRNVPLGVRFEGSATPQNLLASFYSLLSEGGTIFFLNEGQMASERMWESYLAWVPDLRVTAPQREVAVVFPRTAMTAYAPQEFERLIGQLRELFAFDLVDELDLETLNAARYPLIFIPWGSLWTSAAVQHFSRLARSGAALVVQTDQPWRTLDGSFDINEELFAVRLVRQGNRVTLEPRTGTGDLRGEQAGQPRRGQVVELGTAGDVPYLAGEWSAPQTGSPNAAPGIPFNQYRLMGERGQINFSVIPGRKYKLALDAFIPEGQQINVFINGRNFASIQGEGRTQWSQELSGRWQPTAPEFSVLLRGQTASSGEMLSAPQTFRASMAVSRIGLIPSSETLDSFSGTVDETAPALHFEREVLRGSWLREVGQGITLIAPSDHVNQWVFLELLSSIVQNPNMLDPRYRQTHPPDGQINQVFVSPMRGYSLYVNLNDQPVEVGDGSRRSRTLPPMEIFTLQ